MMDDIRDHRPIPTMQERRWMEARPLVPILRAVALAAAALILGWGTALLITEPPVSAAEIAAATR